MRRRLALSFLGFASLPSFACTIGPVVGGYTKDQLIANTKTIVLAECLATTPGEGKAEFRFQTVEVLRGKHPKAFKLALEEAPPSYIEVDYSAHTEPEFWNGTYGRLPWVPGSCTPTYAFEIGGRYLLFIESLGNGAAAERIRAESNKWYQYVRSRAKNAA